MGGRNNVGNGTMTRLGKTPYKMCVKFDPNHSYGGGPEGGIVAHMKRFTFCFVSRLLQQRPHQRRHVMTGDCLSEIIARGTSYAD